MPLALLLPAVAQARLKTTAPPGNSAINQYVEVVPTAKGNRPANTIHPGSNGSGGIGGPGGSGGPPSSGGSSGAGGGSSAVPAATVRAFKRQGKDGLRAAALAQAAAPPGSSPGSTNPSAKASGSSPIATLVNAATGSSSSSGLRSTLPAILLVVAIGGTALGLRRRRTN